MRSNSRTALIWISHALVSTSCLQVNTKSIGAYCKTIPRHSNQHVMRYSPTFSCLPMGTAFCFCTFAVRQSCLLAPAALAGAPGAVASVAAAVPFEPRAPPALAAALDLLLAGCFCKRHQTLLLLAKQDFESCASTGCADDYIADIEHEP